MSLVDTGRYHTNQGLQLFSQLSQDEQQRNATNEAIKQQGKQTMAGLAGTGATLGYSLGGALGGAATGAEAGSAAGPWGAAIGAAVGLLAGYLLS